MSDFTYKAPDEELFQRAVLINLRQNGHNDIASLLDESKCTIVSGSQFSRRRWNGIWTIVHFDIPLDKYEDIMRHITDEVKETLRSVCNEVMPPKSGLDVMEVKFSFSLERAPIKNNLVTNLKKIAEELPPELRSEIIPEDVKEKAKQMSEVYTYLYCVENALRAFIEKIAKENYGTEYIKNLKLNTDMKTKINNRKRSKEKLKWLSVRGDSDISYLDFEDLGTIIRNNWEVFKQYFESQEWIVTNINEIAKCRNPVAHHSYLQEHERDIIRIDFIKIMKQISEAFE